jgi:hypothetical protein
MLGPSKPIPGVTALPVPLLVASEVENAPVHRCGKYATVRFPKLEFYANGVLSAVVRLEAESMHVRDLLGLEPGGIIYRTASEVVFTKPSDQVTPPIFRPRNSA